MMTEPVVCSIIAWLMMDSSKRGLVTDSHIRDKDRITIENLAIRVITVPYKAELS